MIRLSSNRTKAALAAFAISAALVSCKKETNMVGFNTLPGRNGMEVKYTEAASAKISIARDTIIRTNFNEAKMLGSVVDILPNGQMDTIVAELELPLYLEEYLKFWDSGLPNPLKAVFSFSDNIYRYGNTQGSVNLALDLITYNGSKKEYTQISTFDYTLTLPDTVRTDRFVHQLSDTVFGFLVKSVDSAFKANPSGNAEAIRDLESKVLIHKDIHAKVLYGVRVRVPKKSDAFISRISSPRIEILYKTSPAQADDKADNLYFKSIDTQQGYEGYNRPSIQVSHTGSYSGSGIFVQSMLGHRTVLSASWLDSWLDSSNAAANKASFRLEAIANADGKELLPQIRLELLENDKTEPIAFFDAKLDTLSPPSGAFYYTFFMEEHLEKFMRRGIKSDKYQLALSSINNNQTAGKTFFASDSIKIDIIYTKY
jgi:hypothetical protein